MDDTERIIKHHGGPHVAGSEHDRPSWTRKHSLFFWIAAVFLLAAMAVFILTVGFAFRR